MHEIKDKNVCVKRTVKKEVNGTIDELVGAFVATKSQICLHVYTITHQYKQYRLLKEDSNE